MCRKGKDNSNWKGGRTRHSRGYVLVTQPSHPRADSKGYVLEHILIAEKALGKPLPPGAVVHHHGAKDDQTQLVICENQEYHSLLHVRMKALKACGHTNWCKCCFCKQYDKLENLDIRKGGHVHHRKCKKIYMRKYRQKQKEINGTKTVSASNNRSCP